MAADPGDDDNVRLDDLETELMRHLERLENKEQITEGDFEAFRKTLPTEPLLAEAVSKALPLPWAEIFEFVEGSDRQSAYWRTTHDRGLDRSPEDREIKQRFGRAAEAAQGVEGTVERDGQEMPASAARVADVMARSGESNTGGGAGERALKRLENFLKG
jgi:hypothetical protein